jgi:hypothetical protein
MHRDVSFEKEGVDSFSESPSELLKTAGKCSELCTLNFKRSVIVIQTELKTVKAVNTEHVEIRQSSSNNHLAALTLLVECHKLFSLASRVCRSALRI